MDLGSSVCQAWPFRTKASFSRPCASWWQRGRPTLGLVVTEQAQVWQTMREASSAADTGFGSGATCQNETCFALEVCVSALGAF